MKWNYAYNDDTNIMAATLGCRHGMKRRKRGVETDGFQWPVCVFCWPSTGTNSLVLPCVFQCSQLSK